MLLYDFIKKELKFVYPSSLKSHRENAILFKF